MKFKDFLSRLLDTLAHGAFAFVRGVDARKANLPRLLALLSWRVTGTARGEMLGAVWAFALGFWLLLPFDTFGSTKAFSVLAHATPEVGLALVLMAFGLWRLDAVWMGRAEARLRLTLTGVIWEWAFSVLYLLGNPASPAAISYAIMATVEVATYRDQVEPQQEPQTHFLPEVSRE